MDSEQKNEVKKETPKSKKKQAAPTLDHYQRLIQLASLVDRRKDIPLVITGLRMIANDLEKIQKVKASRKKRNDRKR